VIPLHLEIQAIAPPQAVSVNGITDLPYDGGTHVNANAHGIEPLDAKSKGVFGQLDLILGIEADARTRNTMVASKNQNIHLEKDSQIVFRVANP
jgi:hypothetical protein